MVFLDSGEIDGLVQFVGKSFQKRSRQRDEIATHRRSEPQDHGPEPHAPVRGRCNDKLFSFERSDDALHGGTGEVHPLRDLAEAQPGIFLFQRTQNSGRARDHLHLALVVSDVAVHRQQLDTGAASNRLA